MVNHPNRQRKSNSELLAYAGDLLGGLDKQRRFVLRMHSAQRPCPNCATKLNVFEATGVSVDDYDIDGHEEKRGTCPKCKRGLEYVLPMMGDWHWTLVPVQVD